MHVTTFLNNMEHCTVWFYVVELLVTLYNTYICYIFHYILRSVLHAFGNWNLDLALSR